MIQNDVVLGYLMFIFIFLKPMNSNYKCFKTEQIVRCTIAGLIKKNKT